MPNSRENQPNRSRRLWRKRANGTQGFFVHGLHKSATMFLYQFFQHVSAKRGLSFFSINNQVPNHQQDFSALRQSFCLCPIRSFDFSVGCCPSVNESRILQLRDPRDILVSEYFSIGWIHSVEDQELATRRERVQEMSIDDYVLNPPESKLPPLPVRLEPLRGLDPRSSRFTILKYETMIGDLPSWIQMAIAPFGFRWEGRVVRRLLAAYSEHFQPRTESLTHKRKMQPGDYLEKLRPETIQSLNDQYAWFLEKFEYPA